MTCEVVAMNKYGAALAADSAVTVGNGEKIYHHAQKLFSLSAAAPVGVMLSGVPEIMGVPWEIVIKSYARQLGERRCDRLEEYAQDFLCFVESSSALFPVSVQRDWFRLLVESYWRDQLAEPLRFAGGCKAQTSPRHPRPTLAQLLQRDHATWRKYSGKPTKFLMSKSIPGDKVLSDYGTVLDRLECQVFGARARACAVRQALRATVKFMYDKPWFHPRDRSWIAFVGLGEAEPFPVLQEYLVGSIASGQLRWAKTGEARVTRDESAHVVALAQKDTIDMFFRGIDPKLEAKLENIVLRCMSRTLAGERGDRRGRIGKVREAFRRLLDAEIDEKYEAPLLAAVDAMPPHGLTNIAEALVRLTAFHKRICIEQKETVDAAVHAAFISKGDGFAWIGRSGKAFVAKGARANEYGFAS